MSNNKITVPQDFHIVEERDSGDVLNNRRAGRGGRASRELVLVLNQITRKLNAADGQTAVATADASDLATAIALSNSLKTALNLLIAALQK
jgi:hypothetical protein